MPRFTDEEITFFDQEAHRFVQRPSLWRNWCPFKSIPFARKTEWKVLNRIADAHATIDGSRTSLAASTYTWDEAELMWLGHHFEWSEIEVETARRTKNNISTDEIGLAFRKFDKQIERFLLQGSMPWEVPTNVGLIAGATDSDSSATIWDTVGGPYVHAGNGYGILTNLGYDPPFTMLLSDNLRAGLANEHVAGGGESAKSVIRDAFEIDNFQFTAIGANTRDGLTVNPLPAPAGDDGRWLMMKADAENFQLLEALPPTLTLVPEMDVKARSFYGRLDAFFTIKKVNTNAVTDEDSVNRVT